MTDQHQRAEALFASTLQAGESPDQEAVVRETTTLLADAGPVGCSAAMAYEFGEHPELAVRRMRWARQTVQRCFAEKQQ
ncbi:hypothetical protein [Actinoplanes sp. RD1]|uniref:hypothetical protein n=1 Tax=Actinoplanes sp. RD1 TaxID=3064538 RepID=UPI0027416FFC|nr:hypothetical protein [Actinoplanes sp. RD1]